MSTTIRITTLLGAIITITWSGDLPAQTQNRNATLQQTTEWIVNTLSSDSYGVLKNGGTYSTVYKSVTLSDTPCVINETTTQRSVFVQSQMRPSSRVLDLRMLSPDVRVREYSSRSGEFSAHTWRVMTDASSGGEKLIAEVSTRELAERAARAFAHAIRLCGGRAPVF